MNEDSPASADPTSPRTGERWRLDISYRGTGFSGWARQPGLRTVQGELEHWIARILRCAEPVSLVCAGRTDAGVHARGQVAHLDVPAESSTEGPESLQRRLSRVLPDDLVVRRVTRAPAGFDARFAAIWRRYVFRLDDSQAPDPLLAGHVLALPRPLDVELMDAAAQSLLGLHDFAAFCHPRPGATTIRTLQQVQVRRTPTGVIQCTVRADAFCHSMVRSLVGALCAVGRRNRSPDWLVGLLSTRQRANDITVLAPHGLCLEEVGYPDDEELGTRVHQARSTRSIHELSPEGPPACEHGEPLAHRPDDGPAPTPADSEADQ